MPQLSHDVSRSWRLASKTLLATLTVVLTISMGTDFAWAQRSEKKSDRQNQRSTQESRKERQTGSGSSKKNSNTDEQFIVHTKDGTQHRAVQVQTGRNGDYILTLTDGTRKRLSKRDVSKIENTAPEQTDSSRKNQSNSTSNADKEKTRSVESSRSATGNERQSIRRGSQTSQADRQSRKLQPADRVMRNRDVRKKQPNSISGNFTVRTDRGRTVSGVTLKQLDRTTWQLTDESDRQLTLDLSKVGEISNQLESGQKVEGTVGPNGEITWGTPETPTETPEVNSGEIGSSTMYDTLNKNSSPITEQAVRQNFLASCSDLTSVTIKLDGNYDIDVTIRDTQSDSVLGQKTVTTGNTGTTTIYFSPAISLSPGDRYRVEIQRVGSSGDITAYVTDEEQYVFSRMRFHDGSSWGSLSGNDRQNDLVMRVKGNTPISTTGNTPSQTALLVLLENDGIVGSLDAAGIDYPELPDVRYMVYTGNERDIEFKLNQNESIAQALNRVSSDLDEIAKDEVGPPPEPPIVAGVSNYLDPDYVEEMEEYTNKLISFTAKLMNPDNWEIRTESAEDFASTISDLVIEKFTSDYILGKTNGKYSQVVVIEDTQFEAANVLSALEQLSQNYLLDIHVLSHGRVDEIIGHETGGQSHELTRTNFFIPLQQARLRGETPLQLRSVYQCICTGGSLKKEWRAVGAQVVNGTKGEVSGEAKKNYMPQQYVHFLDYWCDQNKTFQQATDLSYDDAKSYSESVYQQLSSKPDLIIDSQLTVSGNGSIKRSP